MIQRIQSIWLLLVAAAAFLSLKLPFYSGNLSPAVPFQFITGSSQFILLLFTVITGVLALFTIFNFKNRKLQLRLCVAGILLEAFLIYLYYRQASAFATGTYALTALLQPAIIVFFVLAMRGINKDEKLVKESNKLR
jgi:hypothetical protein